ncbi:hypothetical protein GOODEAATRI_029273 [Goodea atripinnis]|uniref:HAT C-terminal dimerisation domain-containing protein n=1 Tax=Goodea atripinnis TaxID=208336 RepID=A0ABV0N8C8_9TELE
MSRFPALSRAAHKYLLAPCTSVDCVPLFSAASHIVGEKGNRIQCEKAEMLLFLKKYSPSANEGSLDYNPQCQVFQCLGHLLSEEVLCWEIYKDYHVFFIKVMSQFKYFSLTML